MHMAPTVEFHSITHYAKQRKAFSVKSSTSIRKNKLFSDQPLSLLSVAPEAFSVASRHYFAPNALLLSLKNLVFQWVWQLHYYSQLLRPQLFAHHAPSCPCSGHPRLWSWTDDETFFYMTTLWPHRNAQMFLHLWKRSFHNSFFCRLGGEPPPCLLDDLHNSSSRLCRLNWHCDAKCCSSHTPQVLSLRPQCGELSPWLMHIPWDSSVAYWWRQCTLLLSESASTTLRNQGFY